jgi:CspA family cold shock protein
MGKGRDYRGPKRRGFDDDVFSLEDARGIQPQRHSYSPAPMASAAVSGPTVDATVKWFKADKGFGFVELADGSGDAFLHISVLQAAGHDAVGPGAKLKIQVGQGQKGRQVTAVAEVDTSSTAAPPPRHEPRRAAQADHAPDPSTAKEVDGVVKWFDPGKGFGFVSADDGEKDIFVHISALQKSGRTTLNEGEFVTMSVVQGRKGREAISVTVVPPIG